MMYNKARSASICAFGFPPGSTEYLMACAKSAASTPPPHRHIGGAAAIAAAEDNKRRRPAVRSQSARTSGGRSIRKKALVAAAVGAQHGQYFSDSRTSVRSGYSDPRLHESSPQGNNDRMQYYYDFAMTFHWRKLWVLMRQSIIISLFFDMSFLQYLVIKQYFCKHYEIKNYIKNTSYFWHV